MPGAGRVLPTGSTEAFTSGMTGAALTDMAREMTDANDLWSAAASLAPELAERRQTPGTVDWVAVGAQWVWAITVLRPAKAG